VEFGILGPLELDGEGTGALKGAKPRGLLALLLLQPRTLIPPERLVDDLWEGDPPASATNTLQTYVHHVRKAIGSERLETRPGGYLLAVDPEEIDAWRFERTVRAVAEDTEATALHTATELRDALALWRGDALVEFSDASWASSEIARLSGLQLWAIEARIDADLALGRHAALLPELESLVGVYPLRERFWGQLMLARYRSGRQAEALRAYRQLHTLLDEELGIRPSTDLVNLEHSMLLQEPTLDLPAPARVPVAGEAAGASEGPATGGPRTRSSVLPVALASVLDTPFVGRDQEVDWFAPTEVEGCGALLVAGEAGIGKTRLAAELAVRAEAAHIPVLYGRCRRALTAPYEPWIGVLESLATSTPVSRWNDWVAGRASLARLLPDLVTAAPDRPDADPDAERYRLFEAVTDLLGDAAAARGALIVLDDLHWADEPTLLLLRHLLTDARPERVLVVATYRDTDLLGAAALTETLADLRRTDGVRLLTLAGLAEHDVSELITALTEEHDVSKLARAVRDETDGNPFFVVEVVRHLTETGGLVDPAAAPGDVRDLPPSVREVVSQRVRALGVDVADTLSAAAIVGLEFSIDLLSDVLDVAPETLAGSLDVAVRARVLREVDPGRYAFAHALTQHTLAGDVSATRRRELHRRIAAVLEADHDVSTNAGEIADHLLRADPASPDPRVLEYMKLAGARALTQLAPRDACRWFTEALRVVELLPDVDARTTVALTIALGEAEHHAGDPEHRTTLLQAAELAREAGHRDLLVRAALANTRGFASAAGRVDTARVSVLESAISAVGAGDSSARARLLATFAAELTWDGDWRRRRSLSDEALAMARRVGDPDTLAYVLTRRPNTIWVPDALGERLANTEESLRLARRLDDPVARFWASMYRLNATVAAAELGEADGLLDTMTDIARGVPLPLLQWEAHLHRAWYLLLGGHFADAETEAGQAFEIGVESGQPDAPMLYAGQLLMIRFDQGQLGELEPVLEQQLLENPGIPAFRAALALAQCDVDRLDEAARQLRRAAGQLFEDLPYDQVWLMCIGMWASVAERLADADAAAAIYRLMQPWSGQVLSTGAHLFGACDHWLGSLATVMGELDAAEQHLTRARGLHARLHAPVWTLRTQLARATLLHRRGSRPAVAESRLLAQEVATMAARLECAGLERRAAALIS
jgi:DNA-binding SARP family transcriptional activator